MCVAAEITSQFVNSIVDDLRDDTRLSLRSVAVGALRMHLPI